MRLGSWELGAPLGRGGMGTVYRATHAETGAEVALKTVLEVGRGPTAVLRREIAALARLEHPGVARIVDDGVSVDGLPWYAMEIVPGRTLRGYLSSFRVDGADTEVEDGTLPVSDAGPSPGVLTADASLGALESWWTQAGEQSALATMGDPSLVSGILSLEPERSTGPWDLVEGLSVFRALAEVLAWLHGEGIVHRDLKPENVIVRHDGAPVIVDFGLTSPFAAQGGRESLDAQGTTAGTPSYMAPEQCLGAAVDARADLYALGCMLYELICGQPPFRGASPMAVMAMHVNQPPAAPSSRSDRGDYLPELGDLVLRLLAKQPRDRLGHARDVATALAELGGAAPDRSGWPEPAPYFYRAGLVGRGPEMGRLVPLLRDFDESRSRAALVTGGSGVGKTRLLVELCNEARREDLQVFTGSAAPPWTSALGRRPLEPLRPVLNAVADRCRGGRDPALEKRVAEQANLLAMYEPSLAEVTGQIAAMTDDGLRENENRLLASMEDVLRELVRSRPAMLLLDDLQWADHLTLSVVRHLVRGAAERLPIVVVAAWRSEDTPPALTGLEATRVELGALSPRAVRSMVCDMLALDEPPEPLVAFLQENAEGNPFFVAQHLHAALDAGVLRRDRHRGWELLEAGALAALDLPRGVRDLVARRLGALGEDARDLVGRAAVIGRTVDVELLRRVLRMERGAFEAALHGALRHGLLEDEGAGAVSFGHSTTREVAYAELSPEDRRAAHRAVAQQLDTDGSRPRIRARAAVHWEAAGEPARAAACCVAAARAWADAYAEREAERLYRRALELVSGGGLPAVRARVELIERVLLPAGRDRDARVEARLALTVARATGNPEAVERCRALLDIVS